MTGILETKDFTGGSQSGAVTAAMTMQTKIVPMFFQLIFLNIGRSQTDCPAVELRSA